MSKTKQTKKRGKLVKILGREVREGTKKHALLLYQVKHFSDLQQSEGNTSQEPR